MPRREPRTAGCEANALSTVLWLWLLITNLWSPYTLQSVQGHRSTSPGSVHAPPPTPGPFLQRRGATLHPPLTFRDGRGQRGLAVVHMADGADVHVGLVAHVGLLGLRGQATAQDGQRRRLPRPQQSLQQRGRAGGPETCRGSGLGVRATPRATPPTFARAAIPLPGPSPLKRGVARSSRVVAAILRVLAPDDRGRTGSRVLESRGQREKGTSGQRSLPAEVGPGRARPGASSHEFLCPPRPTSGLRERDADGR